MVRLLLLTGLLGSIAGAQAVRPFESAQWTVPAAEIDARVLAGLKAQGIEPAYPCSDEVFLRRASLDVIGTIPEPDALREFLADRNPGKRAALIEALLQRDEFVD